MSSGEPVPPIEPVGEPVDEPGVAWVETFIDPGEPFRIKLHVGERSWTLGRDGAVRYALAVLQAAHYADHDAATFTLLKEAGADEQAAAGLVVDELRPDREPMDRDALTPLGLELGVAAAGETFLLILLDSQPIGDWTVEGAVTHAMTVLGALFSSGLDAALHQVLVGNVGLDAGQARNAIRGLGKYRRL